MTTQIDTLCRVPHDMLNCSEEAVFAHMFARGIVNENFLRQTTDEVMKEASTSELVQVFQSILETYGQEVGQRVLRERASRIAMTFMDHVILHLNEQQVT